ncbi:uncharacterized, partial [Lates japonicus]
MEGGSGGGGGGLEVLQVVSSASSPRPVKRLTEGCNEAQGSDVNTFDILTLTQPVAETSCCPHTLALISHTHTHAGTKKKKKNTPAYWRGLGGWGAGGRSSKIRGPVEREGKK